MNFSDKEPWLQDASQMMELLSQPVRLKMLCILNDGEQSVLALAKIVGLSQPAISHHLAKLRHAGIVDTRRQGQTIYYSLKEPHVQSVLALLHELYCSKTSE